MLVSERATRWAARVGAEDVTASVRRHAATIGISAILILGGMLRFTGVNWDDSHYLHPDERFLTMVATGITWPGSVGAYFDSQHSTLNPYNNKFGTYIYGDFPLFLAKFVGSILGDTVYGNFHLAGRELSATFDLMTILLVYFVGRRLFGAFAGLLGALLLSLTVLNIQTAHFFTTDSFVTTFCLATFYFALRADETGRWREYVLAGLMAGLAVASKLSALPIVAVVALPVVEQIRLHGWRAAIRSPKRGALPAALGVLLALICAVWTFRIAQPYSFLGPSPFSFRLDPRWTRDVQQWRNFQTDVADMPPSVQWASRTPILFVVKNLVLWGMGVPLAVASLIALALGGIRIATARRWPPTWQVILVGWPAFHILYYGTAFLKTMRYLLPAYPFLALLAAGLLARLWARGERARGRFPFRLEHLPAIFVVLTTAGYALAFTSIYTRPVTRLAASEWIYQNVPKGATRTSENWDDGLPAPLPGYPSPDSYPEQRLDLYADDNPKKLGDLMASLDKSDYIIESSNRLYASIPRLPEHYPMASEYYRMLFSGDLGFKLVKTFTSRPSLFGWELNDDNAEEAFTVYDHPKVLIFQKTANYSHDKVAARLGATLTADIVNIRPVQAGHNLLLMTPDERAIEQAGGTWSAIFDRASIANRHPLRVWYLALQLMALAAFPLCWRVLGGLPDHGYAVAKTLGILVAGYVAWLLASLHVMDFGRGAVLVGIAVAAALSLLAVLPRWRDFGRDMRGRWREVVFAEALFLAALFVFAWFRSKNPDLWHPWRGGEKPMEFAYFNAIVRSTHFPPYDPWFAGGYINYYYFGYALLAGITRLTGVVPAVAFNLAVPTLFALTMLNAWAFAAAVLRLLGRELRLRSRWAPLALGLLGPLFVTVLGNLDMARRIGRGDYGYPAAKAGGLLGLGAFGDVIRGVWRLIFEHRPVPTNAFWDPSRVIDGTINEFPYFTFLFADLHPHLIAIPFTLAALIVALGILQARHWPSPRPADAAAPPEPDGSIFGLAQGWRALVGSVPWHPTFERGLLVALAALVTGALYPMNTWDFPTYLLLTAGAFLLLETLEPPTCNPPLNLGEGLGVGADLSTATAARWRLSFASLRRAALWTVGTLVLGRLLFLPYFAHYEIPNSGFAPWRDAPTRPGQFLLIHGVLLFFVTSFLLAELAATMPARLTWRIVRPVGFGWAFAAGDGSERRVDASLTFAPRPVRLRPVVLAAGGAALLVLLALWRDKIMWLFAALLLLTALVAWQRRRAPVRLFLLGMVGLALAIGAAVERYTLRGDIGRMNTVFKFYLQIWVLLGLAAAIGAAVLVLRYRESVGPMGRIAWTAVGVVLLLGGLAYPVLATPARLDDRFGQLPRTLDGSAYMTAAIYHDQPEHRQPVSYPLASDYRAIQWLLDHVQGSPVILEGSTPLYHWGSRVSIYTGLPTVLGWDWHQTQQRAGYGIMIKRRQDDVQRMLGEVGSFAGILPLLDKYHVRYIYIGDLERAYYNAAALLKFDQGVATGKLTVVYDDSGVKIYRYDGV